jgi:predicted nucleic acid-binding protein
MSDVVADSCVVAKWVLSEADTAKALQVIADVTGAGGRLIVLDLALPEVANAIWKQYYRGLLTLDDARTRLDNLLTLSLQTEAARPLLKAAFEIAARYRRSVYDATFVALARHLKLKGVTSDEPLFDAVHADFPEIVLLRNW